jgi:hypothetical protein
MFVAVLKREFEPCFGCPNLKFYDVVLVYCSCYCVRHY